MEARAVRDEAWPRAILHVDADGFFASCQQVMHAHMRGKPVMTGAERGIITSVSKEAKVLGVGRGITPWEARKLCPEIIFAESDYKMYQVFSKRMVSIVRGYTSEVEHYSIDEVFADITGAHQLRHTSYENLVREIKEKIQEGLGLTVSVGLAVTKTLAKLASTSHKPDGCTLLPFRDVPTRTHHLRVGDVWGIGRKSSALLGAFGIDFVGDFVALPASVVSRTFGKPVLQAWGELRGEYIYRVNAQGSPVPQSMSRVRTLLQPTSSKEELWREISLGVEQICYRLRRYRVGAKLFTIMLKDQSFHTVSQSLENSTPTAHEHEIIARVRNVFQSLVRPGVVYRTTGVYCSGFVAHCGGQATLFGAMESRVESQLYGALDTLREKYRAPVVRTGIVSAPRSDRCRMGDIPMGVLVPVSPLVGKRVRLAFGGM